jgi:ADP-ribose pyrophosphatase YjhB (NUDIX family)
MADTESVDIVDERNNIVGVSDARTAHEQRLLHRVVGLVFDAEGNLFVQTGNKYGKTDLAVGGHVQQGESYEDAARREMCEEIGLDVPIKHVSTFIPENARMAHYWGMFTATAPVGWVFKETEEVKALETMSIPQIQSLIETDPDAFTHGFLNVMKEFARVTDLDRRT